MFNFTITRPSPCPILDNTTTVSPTLDDDVTPSNRTMRTCMFRRHWVMFDKADHRTATARAKYKRYAIRSITHTPLFKKVKCVFLKFPPTEAKTSKEKEHYIAQSKLCYEMTGPYKVISATPDTVTVEHNGE